MNVYVGYETEIMEAFASEDAAKAWVAEDRNGYRRYKTLPVAGETTESNDTKRLTWLEDQHTLHRCVEILYVVDGYELQKTYDCHPVGEPIKGEDLRAAIDFAMQMKAA